MAPPNVRLFAIALGAALGLSGACHRSPRPVLQPIAPCPEPVTDTTSWRRLTAERGGLTLLLPPDSREIPTRCEDSPCGRLQLGSSILSYDTGPFAGPGDTLPLRAGEGEMPQYCTIMVHGLRTHLLTYRVPLNPPPGFPEAAWRDNAGKLVAAAALSRGPGSGLYLSMFTTSPLETAQFLTSVRTLQLR